MMRRMKDDIDQSMHRLIVSPKLRDRILKKAKSAHAPVYLPHSGFIAAAFAVMLSVGVLANAGMLARIRALLGDTYESAILQPVTPKEVSTDCNIRMEVAAALSDGDSAALYIIAQDLLGGRLSEDFQFHQLDFQYESTGSVAWTYRVVKYEPETNSVYLKLNLDGEGLEGKELQFSAKSFFSQWFQEPSRPIFSSLAALPLQTPETLVVSDTLYLKPDVFSIPLSSQRPVFFSNGGIVNGELHLQIKCVGGAPGQFYPDFQLLQNGQPISISGYGTTYFAPDGKGSWAAANRLTPPSESAPYYQELIFEKEDTDRLLSAGTHSIALYSALHGYQEYLSGNWVLDFQLEPARDVFCQDAAFSIPGCQVSSVSLSPMGITIRGYSPDGLPEEEFPVSVLQKDGAQRNAEMSGSTWTSPEPGQTAPNATLRYAFDEVIDVSAIHSISIDGNELFFP